MPPWTDLTAWLPADLPFYLTLAIIAIGIFLFVKEYFTIDVTAILIMTLFIVTGVLAPEEGFKGFTNSATITVACMFVLSFGLFRTGVLDPLIRVLIRLGRWHFLAALVALMLFAATLSAFINDTAVVALLMPAALRLAERTGVAPGKLLMPLSFAALLGGVCTLIGTSTNILVSGIAEEQGFEPLGMFEFAPAAIWLTLAGVAYMLTLGLWILPKRETEKKAKITTFVAMMRYEKGATDIGKPLLASQLRKEYDAEVRWLRNGRTTERIVPEDGHLIQEGDELLVVIERERLRELRRTKGIRLLTEEGSPAAPGELRLYEVVVPKGSRLAGKQIGSWQFLRDLHHGVIGIRRSHENHEEDPSDVPLAEGDILLLASRQQAIYNLMQEDAVTVIDEYEIKGIDLRKALTAALVLVGVIGAASAGLAPIVLSAIVGVLALLLTRVITPEEAYAAVEWKVIFLLAGVLSMGSALQKTGGDQMIANGLFNLLGDGSPLLALSIVFGITFLATNVMSNNATAALMTPIALQLSTAMGVSERPFLVGVMFAASLAFMTPMSYQTNSMIYVPGNYRFNDYLKVGTPLNLIIWAVAMVVIPLYFPF
ncbi:MAG: SLC13 family permease [Flavobacteriales bacterium]|nr:SLC13 family permease [Flavobacteriales bacterium]